MSVLAAKLGRLLAELRAEYLGSGPRHVNYVRFTRDTSVPACFVEARSPWQRGASEVTNGLLGQLLSKGSAVRVHLGLTWGAIA